MGRAEHRGPGSSPPQILLDVVHRRGAPRNKRAADRLRAVSRPELQGLVWRRDRLPAFSGSDPVLRPALLGERAWSLSAYRRNISGRAHRPDVSAFVSRRPDARPLRRAVIDGGGHGPARSVIRSPVACQLKEGVWARASWRCSSTASGRLLAFNASNITGMQSIEAEHSGLAFGVMSQIRLIGYMLGVALPLAVFNALAFSKLGQLAGLNGSALTSGQLSDIRAVLAGSEPARSQLVSERPRCRPPSPRRSAHRVRVGFARRDSARHGGRHRRRVDRAENPPGKNRSRVQARQLAR